jgi:hypothetical protein
LLANKIDGLGEINEIAGLGEINKIAGLGKIKQNCPTWWRNHVLYIKIAFSDLKFFKTKVLSISQAVSKSKPVKNLCSLGTV